MRRRALITAVLAAALAPLALYADNTTNFVPIVPLPFSVDVNASDAIGKYLQGVFKLIFSLSGVLAVGMIIIGGFEYMTSEAMGGKSKGRERIQGALIGLVLLIASYLILYVINPCLLELNPLRGLGSAASTPCTAPSSTGGNGSSLRNPAGSGLPNAPSGTNTGNGTQNGTGNNNGNGGAGAGGTGGSAAGGSGAGNGNGSGSQTQPATGARSQYRGVNLVPSGMALVCYPGECPATGPNQYGTLLPFPQLTGADAQAACGSPNVQSACIYGTDQWLDQSHMEDLSNMGQAYICPQTGNRYNFIADNATFCTATSQLCTVQRVYRVMNGAQNVTECTLSPGTLTI